MLRAHGVVRGLDVGAEERVEPRRAACEVMLQVGVQAADEGLGGVVSG